MAEKILYVNEYCDTGQIRDASGELLQHLAQVVDSCQQSVNQLDPSLEDWKFPLRVKGAISPISLSTKSKALWERNERNVVKVMVAARIMSYPHKANAKIDAALQEMNFPKSYPGAVALLSENHLRLEYLLSDEAQRRLGSLKWIAYTYTENRVLRRMIFDGVCLTQAGKEYIAVRNPNMSRLN